MRLAKWLAGGAAALVLLMIAGVILITSVIDPNVFKGKIETAVRDATGYPFELEGDLDIAWYPWLALQTGPAQLGAEPPLARWKSARIGAQLIPLLRGELVLSRVRLDGLDLQLRRSADGRANWEAFAARQKSTGAKGREVLQLGGLELRDGAATFIDERAGSYARLSAWALDLAAWRPGEPVSIRTQLLLQYGSPAARAIPVQLTLPEVQIRSLSGPISISRFESQVAAARLTGRVGVDQMEPLVGQGELQLSTESLRKLLSDLAIAGPRPRDTETLANLSMTLQWQMGTQGLAVKPLQIRLDRTNLHGELALEHLRDPIWRFALNGDSIDLDRYIELEDADDAPFELPTAALQALRARGVLHFDEARLSGAVMRNVDLHLMLDEGTLSSTTP